jgi:hypothetical protein
MFTFLLILTIILLTLASATRGSGSSLIAHRPYNNRYSDATAARDDWR